MNDVPRWTYWDNLEGGPGEDELQEPPRTFTYTTGTVDPVALKAALAAKALANPRPEHWARRLGRRANAVDLGLVVCGLESATIIFMGVWTK